MKATEGKYYLKVRLEGLPPTLNKLNSMHFMARSRLNKDWREAVWGAIGSKIPEVPLKRAQITITRHSSVEGDGDNYAGGYKAIIDALRHMKILENDKLSNIGNIQTLWVHETPRNGWISLEIQEL